MHYLCRRLWCLYSLYYYNNNSNNPHHSCHSVWSNHSILSSNLPYLFHLHHSYKYNMPDSHRSTPHSLHDNIHYYCRSMSPCLSWTYNNMRCNRYCSCRSGLNSYNTYCANYSYFPHSIRSYRYNTHC